MTCQSVFVTGMGAVAPNGIGVDAFWRSSRNGVSGLSVIDSFDTSDHRVKIGGMVRNGVGAGLRTTVSRNIYDRVSKLAKIAADEALDASRLSPGGLPPSRVGIILGQGLSGMQSVENWYRDYFIEKTGITTDDFIASFPNTPAAILAMEYGIPGLNYTINTACSSGAAAVGLGFQLIRSGILDVCIAGGADAPLTSATLKNFERLRVLNSKSNDSPETASRPFSGDRKGFVLSEGAGILILESEAYPRRGRKPLCEIIGYGSNNNAAHMLAPDKSGQALAIKAALEDAGIQPDQVDYIHAHGTGTKLNDLVETEAIKTVFGARATEIPISSVKSMIGHTIGASAALSIICTIQSINSAFLPPTINCTVPDPKLDLDYVALSGRPKKIRTAIVNAFGFGGNNNIIVLKQYPHDLG